jgi:hypothetical protein
LDSSFGRETPALGCKGQCLEASQNYGVAGLSSRPERNCFLMPAPFACDMTAIPPEERAAHHALVRRLMSVAETRERSDGIDFRFPVEEHAAVAQFIALERLCCPFLAFSLEAPPNRGPLWLHLSEA